MQKSESKLTNPTQKDMIEETNGGGMSSILMETPADDEFCQFFRIPQVFLYRFTLFCMAHAYAPRIFLDRVLKQPKF